MHRRLWLPLALLALGSGACTLLFGDYHVRTDGSGGGGSTGTSTTGPASTTSGTGGAATTSSSTGNPGGGGNGGTGSTSTSGSTSTTSTSSTSTTGTVTNGAACTTGAQCLSGHCFAGLNGGVCCDQACTGGSPCIESCDLSVTYQGQPISWAGQCLPVTSGLRGECPVGRYCSTSKGSCVSGDPYGSACSTSATCASGRCRVGICDSERQPAGSPCLNHYGCLSDTCNPTTHLCQ